MFKRSVHSHDDVECVASADGWAIVHTDDELGKVHYCACGTWRLRASDLRGDIRVIADSSRCRAKRQRQHDGGLLARLSCRLPRPGRGKRLG